MNTEQLGNILESHVNITDLGKMEKHIFKGINAAMKQAVNEAIYETLNDCLVELYITEDQHTEIAEKLKVK